MSDMKTEAEAREHYPVTLELFFKTEEERQDWCERYLGGGEQRMEAYGEDWTQDFSWLTIRMEEILGHLRSLWPSHDAEQRRLRSRKKTEELAEWLYDRFDPDAGLMADECDAQLGPHPPWDQLTCDQHCYWVGKALEVQSVVLLLEESS